MNELIRSSSLRIKLLVSLIAAFVLFTLVLALNLRHDLDAMKLELVDQAEQSMEREVLGRLNSEAARLGNQIDGFLEGVFRVPESLAQNLAASIAEDAAHLSREQVSQLAASTLAAHPDTSALYVQFEANGFDGADSAFIGSDQLHSVADSGALEIYWLRDQQGRLLQERVLDSNEKYDDSIGEFGLRAAEWYLCSHDRIRPCLAEPYLYEISPGYSELMTSLTSPIVVDGRFRGLVGVDVYLPVIQKLTEALSQQLYGGQSRITLLSEKGLIASSSHYRDQLSRPLAEARDTFDGKLLKLHQSRDNTWLHEGVYYLGHEIRIDASGSSWTLLIELPQEVVLAGARQLTDTIDQRVVAIISREIVIGLVVIALAILMVIVLIRSIVGPIRSLQQMVDNLASADGDLTRELHLETHAELIRLSQGFNRFIVKLRAMVNELKEVGEVARGHAVQGKAISLRSLQATREQQQEIDNVVTASNEMSATAAEVSQVAVSVADNAQSARGTIETSQQQLQVSVQSVQALTEDMARASESISEVAVRSNDINRILDVIRAIAEQTNLLALNAAIEAARAGEQGRGFAVVADEVRSLASKTQASTEEINSLILSLKEGVGNAVAVIERGTEKARGAMEQTRTSYDSLSSVVADIGAIADHIAQVATAAEEQSSVSEEVSRNLTVIGDAVKTLAEMAHESDRASDELTVQMQKLEAQLSSLKT